MTEQLWARVETAPLRLANTGLPGLLNPQTDSSFCQVILHAEPLRPSTQNLSITGSSQIPSPEFFLQTFSFLLINSDKEQGQKAPLKTQNIAVRFSAGRESGLL